MKTHLLFLPYDDELSLIPDLKLFNLRYNCVSFIKSGAISDTQITRSTKQLSWPAYKQETLQKAEKISGCHYPPREAKLMDFLYEKKPKSCVEIGAFGGLISYQIAKTLQFLGDGLLHAIDGWDGNLAKEGIKERKLVTFWQTLNMETLYQEFQSLISLNNLEKYCIPIRGDSKKMVSLFDDNSIDFLYIDGNASFEGSLQDVLLYFPKVKEGGYIWFNDACQITKHGSVSFLMSHAKWLKEASLDHQSIVFQKTKKESNL